ncbi:MAG: DinB family protein [Isosphaeraceae bacterium]
MSQSEDRGPNPSATRSKPLIDRYATGGAVLAYAVSELSAEHEHARPGPGAWSISEVVGHLLDTDLVYADRMKRLIAEDDPVLLAFDETRWAERLGYQQASLPEAVSLLSGNRRWMTAILRRLADADFARAGRHSVAGRVTLAEALATVTNHLDHHLRFIYAKRATLGVGLPPRYPSEALPK